MQLSQLQATPLRARSFVPLARTLAEIFDTATQCRCRIAHPEGSAMMTKPQEVERLCRIERDPRFGVSEPA